MPQNIEIYLDIETDWHNRLTVIGFYSSVTEIIQLVGEEITPRRLNHWLPKNGRLYTYNGHCFDLRHIRNQLGMDLRSSHDSWDLRWICQRRGLCGGQKKIEYKIGFRRSLDGMDGLEAINLWNRYRNGDKIALKKLLQYNKEDVIGIRAIKRFLSAKKLLKK